MEISSVILIANFALNFLIVPLIVILWRLNENIHELRVTLHRDFVTHDRLNQRLMTLERRVLHEAS